MRSSADEALAAAATIADELREREADAAAEAKRAADAAAAEEVGESGEGGDEKAVAEAAGRHIHLHLHAEERVDVAQAGGAKGGPACHL
jgi:hypothetical protein